MKNVSEEFAIFDFFQNFLNCDNFISKMVLLAFLIYQPLTKPNLETEENANVEYKKTFF
jgi:hypothetical protein